MCDAAGLHWTMADDPPPPYTACEYETKFNPALQPTAPEIFKPQDGQTLPPPGLPASSPLQSVAYYPASSSGSASILLQPQPQQQPQVVVIQSPPMAVVPPVQQVPQSFKVHIWISCLSCWLCWWACPCNIVAFILASKSVLCILSLLTTKTILSSIGDRGQTDRVTTPSRAGLRVPPLPVTSAAPRRTPHHASAQLMTSINLLIFCSFYKTWNFYVSIFCFFLEKRSFSNCRYGAVGADRAQNLPRPAPSFGSLFQISS